MESPGDWMDQMVATIVDCYTQILNPMNFNLHNSNRATYLQPAIVRVSCCTVYNVHD